MAKPVAQQQQIIMNYSVPPGMEVLEIMAATLLDSLPEELLEHCDGLAIRCDDFPDDNATEELDLEDPYDLLALYKSGKEIAPGVEKKTANDDDILIIYRRPILDMWCESGEDLIGLMRQVMIEELGRHFDFSDEDIEEMARRHYQGML
jgi:predicted Zn-dependent protease with MMP-like domain